MSILADMDGWEEFSKTENFRFFVDFQWVLMVLERQTSFMVTNLFSVNQFYKLNFIYFQVCYSLYLLLLLFISWNWGHLAIRFVLSDLFQNLRSEDRHALLHVCIFHFFFHFC